MIYTTDFEFLVGLLREHAGLALGDGKQQVVAARLAPVATRHGYDTIAAMVAALRARCDATLVDAVCDAVACMDSSFFRDTLPFELLREGLLPELIEARRASRRIRILSAGVAAGQEPYSIAITLAEHFPVLAGWEVSILAVDRSEAALARARAGVYAGPEIGREVPDAVLARYFEPYGADWRVDARIRAAVEFRRANLIHPLVSLGCVDVVLCRNVLIDFDVPTKREVIDRLAHLLASDGYLLLGAGETAVGLTTLLERVPDLGAGVYRRAAGAAVAPAARIAS